MSIPFYKQLKNQGRGQSLCLVAQSLLLLGLFALFAPALSAEDDLNPSAETEQAQSRMEETFTLDSVAALASELASAPYRPAQHPQAEFLSEISEWQWNALSFKPEKSLWRNLPFELEFFHPGFIYNNTVEVAIVRQGRPEPLAFDPELFNYPDARLKREASERQLGFAGFRLRYPLNDIQRKDEFLVFLGATHFRSLARHAAYGLMARGLIINPAAPEGEQFPYFRRFWLVEPAEGQSWLTIYALMDSPALTGAYEIVVKPGLSVVMEVSARLFPRSGSEYPARVGLAPLSTMYLYSEKENGSPNDYRPELHNSDALLFSSGPNEWIRRPLSNPKRLQSHSFELKNPRGFGLIQQDDSFDHYQDLTGRFERRSSLWIEPKGDWGPGSLELVEIPSCQEIHDNVLAFWVARQEPAQPPQAGGAEIEDQGPPPPRPMMNFASSMYWLRPNVVPHSKARAVATRLVRLPDSGRVKFLVDFEGRELEDMSAETGLSSVVESSAEAQVLDRQLIKNPVTGGWRLIFTVEPSQDNGVIDSLRSARGQQRTLRLWAFLKKGENLPQALTETWIYDLDY